MNAVDTNVLIYAHDPRDTIKQNQAVSLIASLTNGVLLWQVACEYVAASRKLAAYDLESTTSFRRFATVTNSMASVLSKLGCITTGGNADDHWQSFIVGCHDSGGLCGRKNYHFVFRGF